MKNEVKHLIETALSSLVQKGALPADLYTPILVEHARDQRHGDFACSIAMSLAKELKKNPRQLAEELQANMPSSDLVAKTEIAGPGFLNFFLRPGAYLQVVKDILVDKQNYGRASIGAEEKVHLEIISANPTGPLHVGHGRLAAYGATVANLLGAIGFDVHREYYVNDSGRQMRILALSIWLRYLELFGEKLTLPTSIYRGDYIIAIAQRLRERKNNELVHSAAELFKDLPTETVENKEKFVDALAMRAETLLGKPQFREIRQLGLDEILADIIDDLEGFGVKHDEFYPESQLAETGAFKEVIEELRAHDAVYEKDKALWFRATDFGDEKDRVVLRENGEPTYFAADIAYHLTKFERGFLRAIDIFGADHHGYVARMNAFFQAIGKDPKKLAILLVQFAILYRGQQKVSMSTRAGEFVTLRQLREEVGNDAARFFYIMRKREQHLDFDLELAKSKTSDNPVYYIQYAHARICSVFRQCEERNVAYNEALGLEHLHLLTAAHEQQLLRQLASFQETILNAGLRFEPHTLASYLQDLANRFHTYYNAEQFLVDDAYLRNARLCLISAARWVLANGLKLLGVSAPMAM